MAQKLFLEAQKLARNPHTGNFIAPQKTTPKKIWREIRKKENKRGEYPPEIFWSVDPLETTTGTCFTFHETKTPPQALHLVQEEGLSRSSIRYNLSLSSLAILLPSLEVLPIRAEVSSNIGPD